MAYMVNCVARFAVNVSNVSANGIPVGDDATGTGSATAPYLTIAKARQVTPLGGRIILNGTAGAPAVYDIGSAVARSVTIEALVPLGAIIAGTGATQAITLQPDLVGQTFTFRDLIIDPSQNTGGGPGNRCITITASSLTFLPNITFDGVLFQNWITYAITSDLNLRLGTVTLTDAVFNGGTVSGAVNLNGTVKGHLVVNGGSCTIAAFMTTTIAASIFFNGGSAAASADTSVSITDFSQTITLNPAIVGTNNYYGIRILNVAGVLVDGGTHQVLGAPGDASGVPVSIESNVVALPFHGATVRRGTFLNTTKGGYGVAVGSEGPGTFVAGNGCLIELCTITGSATSAAGGLHGAFLGVTANSTIQGCSMTDTGIAVVLKESTNAQAIDNIVRGFSSSALLAKGVTTGLYDGNQVTQTGAYSNADFISIEENNATLTPSTNVAVTGTICIADGGITSIFVELDTFSSFTPTNNSYIVLSGTMALNQFQIAGVNYTSCGAYKAAVEPTAVCSPI